jgi:hypothetical protein
MPEENPHPLRFGWHFEADLSPAAAASVALHQPQFLHRAKAQPTKGASDGHEESNAPDEAHDPLQGLPQPEGLHEGGQVREEGLSEGS